MILDLNPAWPLGSDPKDAGDNHLRNIKTAVRDLAANPTGLAILGFATVEMLLTEAINTIYYLGPVHRGGIVTVILRQDATGGRLIVWDPIFRGAPAEISPYAGTYNIYMFVAAAAGDLVLCARPMLDVSI
jgi:hypothetical protein